MTTTWDEDDDHPLSLRRLGLVPNTPEREYEIERWTRAFADADSEAGLNGHAVHNGRTTSQAESDPEREARAQLVRLAWRIRSAGDMAAEVDAAPDPGWLLEGLIAADGYGVLGAEKKAGKTWMATDLAVAVASGGAWLGWRTCTTPGRVLYFAGEGGARKITRRGRAVAHHYGRCWDDLDIWISERVPHLADLIHVEALTQEVADHIPKLVIIDPSYLALAGARMSALNEMGALLEAAQHACQAVGAVLLVVAHWNKTGTGVGVERFSGAGFAEWGRFLISAAREGDEVRTPDGGSNTVLRLTIVSDEAATTELMFRREVHETHPGVLASPMVYTVQLVDAESLSTARNAADDNEAVKLIEASPGINTRTFRTAFGGNHDTADATLDRLIRARRVRTEKVGTANHHYVL